MQPLTLEQQRFAEKNHDLVYGFLKQKNLSMNTYYDIIIFGYLQAVQEYCEHELYQQYAFSTIAWRKMQSSLNNYYRTMKAYKRNANTVSLQSPIGAENGLRWEEITSKQDNLMTQLEVELLLHSLAFKLSEREMTIIRMKANGRTMHEIAKKVHLKFHDINSLLSDVYEIVIEELYD